jgi:hypothetical protein
MGKLAHGALAKFPLSFDRVVETLTRVDEASNVFYEVYSTRPRTALFFGEKYYIRAGSSLAVAVFVIEASGYTVVKAFATGGKSGLLDFMDWGASRSYVSGVINKISELTGVKPIEYREVHRLDVNKADPLRGL